MQELVWHARAAIHCAAGATPTWFPMPSSPTAIPRLGRADAPVCVDRHRREPERVKPVVVMDVSGSGTAATPRYRSSIASCVQRTPESYMPMTTASPCLLNVDQTSGAADPVDVSLDHRGSAGPGRALRVLEPGVIEKRRSARSLVTSGRTASIATSDESPCTTSVFTTQNALNGIPRSRSSLRTAA